MRAALAAVMVIGIVACHRAPEVEPWPARELGDYSYRISGTSINGRFTILPDTVTLDVQQRSCRPVNTDVPGRQFYYFRCIGGPMVFNTTVYLSRPLLSTWSTSTTVKKKVEICLKY